MIYLLRFKLICGEGIKMPFIHVKTNRTISRTAEETLTSALGEAVSLLGKSESWLMLQFEDGCRLAFRGKADRPLAFVNVRLYGNPDADACGRFTARVTALISQTLSIDPDGIYAAYFGTEHWGWQGADF